MLEKRVNFTYPLAMTVLNESKSDETEAHHGEVDARITQLEDRLHALSRLMTLMLVFVFTVTLVLFMFHWAGHALTHSHP